MVGEVLYKFNEVTRYELGELGRFSEGALGHIFPKSS
jgi:hypothetical protein